MVPHVSDPPVLLLQPGCAQAPQLFESVYNDCRSRTVSELMNGAQVWVYALLWQVAGRCQRQQTGMCSCNRGKVSGCTWGQPCEAMPGFGNKLPCWGCEGRQQPGHPPAEAACA